MQCMKRIAAATKPRSQRPRRRCPTRKPGSDQVTGRLGLAGSSRPPQAFIFSSNPVPATTLFARQNSHPIVKEKQGCFASNWGVTEARAERWLELTESTFIRIDVKLVLAD